MSFGDSSSNTSTNQTTQRQPYQPFVSPINTLAGDIGKLLPGAAGLTSTETGAISDLEKNAGNPWAATITKAAGNVLNGSQAGTATDAYGTLKSNLGGVASGSNVADIMNSPEVKAMLGTISQDAYNNTAGRFAAAGRDPTGNAGGQQAIARGISQGESANLIPLLENEQARSDAANSALFNAGQTTAGNVQGLNEDAATTGTGLASAGVTATNTGAMNTLAAEAMKFGIPADKLQSLAAMLFPGAQLGGTTNQTGNSNTDSSGAGVSVGDVGKGLTGLAAIMPFL